MRDRSVSPASLSPRLQSPTVLVGLAPTFGPGTGGRSRTLGALAPSVISIAWSAARSRKVWVVRLVGQVTVSADDGRRVEQADRLDEAVAAEAASCCRSCGRSSAVAPSGPSTSTRILAPMRRAVGPGADELDLQPVAAVAGVLEQGVVAPVARVRRRRARRRGRGRRRRPSRRTRRRAPSGGGRCRTTSVTSSNRRPPTFLNIRLGTRPE